MSLDIFRQNAHGFPILGKRFGFTPIEFKCQTIIDMSKSIVFRKGEIVGE